MKQIENAKWNNFKEKLLPLPFFLLMTLAVVLFLGGLLFLMYSIILVVALNSAMVFMIVFAASGISVGLGLLSLHGFFAYGKYYKKQKGELVPNAKKDPNEKTFKDYITLQNVALIVLLIAAVCSIVSAALGCINRDKWVNAISPYMASHEYYADVAFREYKYNAGGVEDSNKIVIDLDEKNAVIVYTDDPSKQSFVVINGFEKYVKQINVTQANRVITISEGQKPELDGVLEKLLFFMFDENKIERQIKIYIPVSQKDSIIIEGEYIISKN